MKRMCGLNMFGLLLFHLIFSPAVFGATGQEVLKEIQNRYEKTNDFEASFIQEYVGKGVKQSSRGEGKVYFKKKGMMRWDYTVPNQKLVSDGHKLWYYQPEEKQVFVSDISKVLREKTPLAFLAGEGNLSRDFILVNFNESLSAREENYVVELSPREPNATLSKLVLTVDKATYAVIQTDVIDELGNITRTRFLNIKTNVSLQDSLFQFTIPPGTEIIRNEGGASSPGSGKGTSQ
jgi:outer membrane lipoprotein carrier protein